MGLKEDIQQFAGQPLPKQIIFDLLEDYKRPFDKINELVKSKDLVPVKRGIYITGPNLKLPSPEPFLLANHLLGPSYVSTEAALFYWGLIPEQVFEINSMTVHASKIYKTPAGRFSYTHSPLPYYSFGIQQVQLGENQIAMVASPEKALCDKIITTSGILLRSTAQAATFLLEDLRIDETNLAQLNASDIEQWIAASPKKTSLKMLVKTLRAL